MLKKIICIFLALISLTRFAVSAQPAETIIQTSTGETVYTGLPTLDIKSKSYVLIDQISGKILYENNKDERLPMASITKVMTLLLVMESLENGILTLNQKVSCSSHASSMGGSQIWLEVGEEMTVHELLKATVIKSANDAAVCLAEAIGGSEEGFVSLMNEKAKELGMENTNFINASGLDAENHYSSAYDIAIMSRELLKHKLITSYTTIWMDSLRDGKTELTNTNNLIRFYKGATGLKTGYTSKSGYCLSASATRDNMSLIGVVMGCESIDERFKAATSLLNYGFANFCVYTPQVSHDQLHPVRVIRGIKEYANIETPSLNGIVVPKSAAQRVETHVNIIENVSAPVEKGQTLGEIAVTLDGINLLSVPLVSAQHIEKLTVSKAFIALLLQLIFVK